jgi:hypothetical protein
MKLEQSEMDALQQHRTEFFEKIMVAVCDAEDKLREDGFDQKAIDHFLVNEISHALAYAAVNLTEESLVKCVLGHCQMVEAMMRAMHEDGVGGPRH